MERERDEMKEQCDLLTEQLDFQRNLSREYIDLNTGWRKKWECAVEMAALAEIERDEARGIIAACMSELPVGYIPAHTPENLPSRIADLVGQLVGLERERDVVRAEAIKYIRLWESVSMELETARFGSELGDFMGR
jgi:hypothetical protein